MKKLRLFSSVLEKMSNSKFKLTFVFLVALSTFAFYSSSISGISKEKIQIIKANKAYTLELAEAMPADKYTFRPHDSVRSFGEQMAHIAMSTNFLIDLFINDQPLPSDPAVFAEVAKMEKKIGQSKEECAKMLNEAFDTFLTICKSADESLLKSMFTVAFDPRQPSFTKATGIDFLNDHILHHRSQALVSLRMQGIEAPQFRLYELE